MTEPKADKKAESIAAMKNANAHLSILFADMTKKDLTLKTCSADLVTVSRQCGELQVKVWVGNEHKTLTLASYLNIIATNLESARS